MIKCRRRPGSVGMTSGTVLIELIGYVIGIKSTQEIRLMATVALGCCAFKLCTMASGAVDGLVRAGQRIGCFAVVIKTWTVSRRCYCDRSDNSDRTVRFYGPG